MAQRFGLPVITNTDQGRAFTSIAWTIRPNRDGSRISMDGRNRFLNNTVIEWLSRLLKYAYVYLHAFSGDHEYDKGCRRSAGRQAGVMNMIWNQTGRCLT